MRGRGLPRYRGRGRGHQWNGASWRAGHLNRNTSRTRGILSNNTLVRAAPAPGEDSSGAYYVRNSRHALRRIEPTPTSDAKSEPLLSNSHLPEPYSETGTKLTPTSRSAPTTAVERPTESTGVRGPDRTGGEKVSPSTAVVAPNAPKDSVHARPSGANNSTRVAWKPVAPGENSASTKSTSIAQKERVPPTQHRYSNFREFPRTQAPHSHTPTQNANKRLVRAPSDVDASESAPKEEAVYVVREGRSLRRVTVQASVPSEEPAKVDAGGQKTSDHIRRTAALKRARATQIASAPPNAAKKRARRSSANKNATFNAQNKTLDRRRLQNCLFFARFGHCKASESPAGCPFLHDPTAVGVCRLWLVGRCEKTAGSCNLSHAVDRNKMPVCERFLRGCCARRQETCPYLHVSHDTGTPLCEAFALRGFCKKGAECDRVHTWNCLDFVRNGECPKRETCRLRHWSRRRREQTQSNVDLFDQLHGSDSESNRSDEDDSDEEDESRSIGKSETQSDARLPETESTSGPNVPNRACEMEGVVPREQRVDCAAAPVSQSESEARLANETASNHADLAEERKGFIRL